MVIEMLVTLKISRHGRSIEYENISIDMACHEIARASIIGKYSVVALDNSNARIAENIIGAPTDVAYISQSDEIWKMIAGTIIAQLVRKANGEEHWSRIPKIVIDGEVVTEE